MAVRGGIQDGVHLGVLLRVHNSCDWDAEIGDGTPEICKETLVRAVVKRLIGQFGAFKRTCRADIVQDWL